MGQLTTQGLLQRERVDAAIAFRQQSAMGSGWPVGVLTRQGAGRKKRQPEVTAGLRQLLLQFRFPG